MMHRWSRFYLLLPLLLFTGTCGAPDDRTGHLQEPVTVPESRSESVGVTTAGAPGISERVDDIMARSRAFDAQIASFATAPRRPLKPRLQPPHRENLADNPLAQDAAQWPLSPRIRDTLRLTLPQPVGVNFLGAQLSDSNAVPPDSMGAVGPTQFLMAINGRIRVFSKTGTLGPLDADLDVFFAPVRGSSFTSDPRVRYDRLSGRWFITVITFDNVATEPANRVLIAVSSGATITGSTSFTFFQFVQDQVGTTPNADTGRFLDYDTLGIDNNALYIGGNMFDTSGSFAGTSGFVVRKSSVLGSGPIVVTPFRGLVASGTGAGPYTPQGVDNDDPTATEGYFIGVDNAAFSLLVLRRVSNPGGTPTISANINLTVPTTRFPRTVPAQGSSLPLDALDDRLYAAQIKNGSLWTAHNINVSTAGVGSATTRANGARFYEITNLTGTPTLRQSGTLFDPATTSPRNYWIPSVAASGQGHMALGCSVAGATTFAAVAVAGRLAGDTLGTIQAATIGQASTTAYNAETSGVTAQRWGDYSFTSVDPNDNMTMWTVQEYCNAINSWGVRVIQLSAPPPATPTAAAPATLGVGSTGVSVVVTGTSTSGSGFYDPGASFPNHISAAVGGSGVTVNGVTYTNPTSITLNVSVASGATLGARTIQVTNPDGQTAGSAAGIVTIVCPTGATCDDGNACTTNDRCDSAGACVGTPVVCTALDQCHVAGVCNPASGQCSNPNATDGTSCNDGNACTQTDRCQAGTCTGNSPVTCTALDQCHVAGVCNPASGQCSNPSATDGTSCNDGNACTQTDTCQAGACNGNNPVTCAALDQCHVAGTCNPTTGQCSNPNAQDGTSCNDGNACTQTDTCQAGACNGNNPVTCAALDQCHVAGTCNPATGQCSNPNAQDGTSCNDGNACTQTDTCQAGACNGSNPVTCAALDQCHVAGTCNPTTGQCSNPNATDGTSCNDGNACT
ncbi:MAG TPA: hypothetical protein VH877_12050, partial [Polyangia bacterium]|nr:hypothetical protein [Polyangia bacterium]